MPTPTRYFAALMQDIEQAAAHIDLETYIFDLDPLGREVAEHLAAAGRRGVVRKTLVGWRGFVDGKRHTRSSN